MSNEEQPAQRGPVQKPKLSELSDEELHKLVLSGGDLTAAFRMMGLQQFANSNTYRFGWLVDDHGDYVTDEAWIPIPDESVRVLGSDDVADDLIELTPLGNPRELSGIKATWYADHDQGLEVNLAVCSNDGHEWRLAPLQDGIFVAELPAELAQIVDPEVPTYEIELVVTVLPSVDDLEDIEDIGKFVAEWATNLMDTIGIEPRDSVIKPLVAAKVSAMAERALPESSFELPLHRAQELGLYRRVSWRLDGFDLVVIVVPDPDARHDKTDRIVVAAADESGEIMAVGKLELRETHHTCRLIISDPNLVSMVVLGELTDK